MEEINLLADNTKPTLSSAESSLMAITDNIEHQYILPLEQNLHEYQQLAIELTSDDGVKYLYILNDGSSEQKIDVVEENHDGIETIINEDESHDHSNIKTGDNVENSKNNDDKAEQMKYNLKQIEDRSCGTMTEEHYLEPVPEEMRKERLSKVTVYKRTADSLVIVDSSRFMKKINGSGLVNCKMLGKSSDQKKGSEINIMNEMKIVSLKKCQDATMDTAREKEVLMSSEVLPILKDDNKESDDKDDKPKENIDKKTHQKDKYMNHLEQNFSGEQNVVDSPLQMDHVDDYPLQLDHVDNETCKEILASIKMTQQKKETESKMEEVDKNSVKRKFQYERPTTRNMDRNKNKGNTKKVKNRRKTKTYECDICYKVYYHNHTLQEHKKNHDNVSYPCNICHKIFNSQKKLSSHIKRHSTEPCHLCDICGQAFRIKETLQNHMYTHSGTNKKPFKCEECGISFIRKHYLIRHSTRLSGEKPFSCKECGKNFRTKGDLHRHDRLHGENPDVKQYKCKICGKRFCAKSGLQRHERAHKGERPYPCTVCSKSFAMPGDLKRHNKTHFGGDYFPCTACGKVLTSSVGFKRHKRMHSGEKPYECTICHNRFIDQWGLIKHQRKHVGDKEELTLFEDIKLEAEINVGQKKIEDQLHIRVDEEKQIKLEQEDIA